MTAVAASPNIHSRPWSSNQHGLESMSSEYMQHSRGKSQRWSSGTTPSGPENGGIAGWSGSLGGGGGKKKGPTRVSSSSGGGGLSNGLGGWPKADGGFFRPSGGNGTAAQPQQTVNGQNGTAQPQSYLMLLPLNGTFERKQIPLPYFPETLRIGRQTNAKTVPTPTNGYFDSKVLSRQHAEVWADKATGKVWIRDIKSSNGTFVNGQRLSPENQDSDAQELRSEDVLELGIDIVGEDNKTIVHHKVAARVEHAGISGPNGPYDLTFGDVDGLVNGNYIAPQSASQNGRGRAGPAGPRNAITGQIPMAHRQAAMIPSVTMEMIVKKLNAELYSAKQQSKDLQKTAEVLDGMLTAASVKDLSESLDKLGEKGGSQVQPLANGIASLKSDGFLPPPSGPVTGIPGPDGCDVSSRPASTDHVESPQQLLSLVDALAQAKKEMELKTSRVLDLEEALRREREAREEAENRAAQLESASLILSSQNPPAEHDEGGRQVTINGMIPAVDSEMSEESDTETVVDEDIQTRACGESVTHVAACFHQKRLEELLQELRAAQEKMEEYRIRAEKAESERDADRKTLHQMIQSLREKEVKRQRRASEHSSQTEDIDTESTGIQVGLQNTPKEEKGAVIKHEPKGQIAHAHNKSHSNGVLDTTPYATVLGVLLFGAALMAGINGWQRTDR